MEENFPPLDIFGLLTSLIFYGRGCTSESILTFAERLASTSRLTVGGDLRLCLVGVVAGDVVSARNAGLEHRGLVCSDLTTPTGDELVLRTRLINNSKSILRRSDVLRGFRSGLGQQVASDEPKVGQKLSYFRVCCDDVHQGAKVVYG